MLCWRGRELFSADFLFAILPWRSTLDSSESARFVVDTAISKKATDVVLLDIKGLTTIADYFVICTGSNSRQIAAIADAIHDDLRKKGARVRQEGDPETGWLLLDIDGDVFCHIFAPVEREYYQLERLWNSAPRLLYVE